MGDEDPKSTSHSRTQVLKQYNEFLIHACQCRDHSCSKPLCIKMKQLLRHARDCKMRASGKCTDCNFFIKMCTMHAQECRETKCPVPLCANLKQKMREKRLREQARSFQLADQRIKAMNRSNALPTAANVESPSPGAGTSGDNSNKKLQPSPAMPQIVSDPAKAAAGVPKVVMPPPTNLQQAIENNIQRLVQALCSTPQDNLKAKEYLQRHTELVPKVIQGLLMQGRDDEVAYLKQEFMTATMSERFHPQGYQGQGMMKNLMYPPNNFHHPYMYQDVVMHHSTPVHYPGEGAYMTQPHSQPQYGPMSGFNMAMPMPHRVQIDRRHIKEAMKDGSVTTYVTKAVIQGEARAGKTSVKCLLLSKKYDDETSTSCIEAPWVGVRCYGDTGKQWELVDEKNMHIKVIAEVRSTAEENLESVDTLPVIHDDSLSDTQSDISDDNKITLNLDSDSSTDRNIIAKVREFYEKCKDSQEKGSRLREVNRWLYFIDSGGQLPFQKLLPIFMPFASVLILVINLTKNLSSPSSTALHHQGRTISTGEHSPSIEEVLQQIIAAIALSTQQYRSFIANDDILSQYIHIPTAVNESTAKLQVIAIATHEDEIKEEHESLDDKEEKLDQLFEAMETTCTVTRKEEGWSCSILHMVNGLKAKSSVERKKEQAVRKVEKMLNDNAYKMEVPLKWHCFGVLLHEVTKEEGHCGVLSLSECQRLGSQLGDMSEDEVVSALKFFHILNKLLYYHDSPASDMVFVRLDSLMDIIKDLVVKISEARCNWANTPADVKKLATEGILLEDTLERSPSYCCMLEHFNDFNEKLQMLFEHLCIAVVLRDCSLVPALLPMKEVSNVVPFPNTTPLLFYFEKSIPMGLFCKFIVCLSRDRKRWKVLEPDDGLMWSNYFSLQYLGGCTCEFIFVEKFECIEVHAEFPSSQAKEVIEDAMIETCKFTPDKAFYCQCSGKRHIAVICDDWDDRIRCKASKSERVLPLTDAMAKWINKDTGPSQTGLEGAVISFRTQEAAKSVFTEKRGILNDAFTEPVFREILTACEGRGLITPIEARYILDTMRNESLQARVDEFTRQMQTVVVERCPDELFPFLCILQERGNLAVQTIARDIATECGYQLPQLPL